MTVDSQESGVSGLNRSAARRIPLEVFNERRLDIVDEVVAEDYVEHARLPGLPPGIDGLKAFVARTLRAFPDFYYSVVDELGEGDIVMLRLRGHGTHSGEPTVVGPDRTGRYAEWEELHLARMRDGRLIEHWAVADRLSQLRQLGLLALPGVATA